MGATKGPDDDVVGTKRAVDDGRQTAQQKAVLGGGGEDGAGVEESKAGWGKAGPDGAEPGRAPVAIGGNSQGQGDRMPAGGRAKEPATNPKYRPGERHES